VKKLIAIKADIFIVESLGAIKFVFGNINTTKGLDWFSLWDELKVNAQWLMFCMAHNIEKLQRHGPLDRTSREIANRDDIGPP